MDVQIVARVPDDMREATSQELDQLRQAPDAAHAGISVTSVTVEPLRYELDDGDGGVEIAGLLIQIATGVTTSLLVAGLLGLIKQGVERIANRVRRADMVELTLRTPEGVYNLVRQKDRLRLKAKIEKEVVFDDPAELDRQFEALSQAITQRFRSS